MTGDRGSGGRRGGEDRELMGHAGSPRPGEDCGFYSDLSGSHGGSGHRRDVTRRVLKGPLWTIYGRIRMEPGRPIRSYQDKKKKKKEVIKIKDGLNQEASKLWPTG